MWLQPGILSLSARAPFALSRNNGLPRCRSLNRAITLPDKRNEGLHLAISCYLLLPQHFLPGQDRRHKPVTWQCLIARILLKHSHEFPVPTLGSPHQAASA